MDVVNLLASLGIEFKQHGENSEVTSGFVGVRCPLCSPHGDRYKLGIPITVPWMASCWTCGKMRLWDFLIASGVSREVCKERLGTLDRGIPIKKTVSGTLVMPRGMVPLMPVHRRYLEKRGFDPGMIESLWGVQCTGNTMDRTAWRLVIPITWRGKVVSWTSRSISNHVQPKYLTASPQQEAMPSKEMLYGHDLAGHSCIVVEGPTDAWRIGPGAVATLGTVYSKAQVVKLSRFSLRVLCFDAEPKAQQRANVLAGQLSVFDGETMVVQLDAADPGSARQKEVNALRRMLR